MTGCSFTRSQRPRCSSSEPAPIPIYSCDKPWWRDSPDDMEELAEQSATVAHCRHVAAQPGVETEAAPGRMQRKHEHHDGEEDIFPRPLRRLAGPIDAEPQVQHEDDRETG